MDHGQDAEQSAARDLDVARQHLLGAGASELPALPWMHHAAPPEDVMLLRFAVWRASGGASVEDLKAGMRLLESARAELDGLETGLLFVARSEGMTWSEIAHELGVRSPQAAQQRFQRVSRRPPSTEAG